MNPLHFILFVLLGFLATSAAAFPHQTIDVVTGNIGNDADRAAGKELVPRQGYPNILLQYDLKCALDRKKTPWAPRVPNSYLTATYCKNWWVCQTDGKELQDIISDRSNSLTMDAVGTKIPTGKQPQSYRPIYDIENRDWQVPAISSCFKDES